ncbi:ras-responsive element-binding protein 1-like [Anthonomus grandis grandis]|uniref:ras-responsive element-binding protein 1-like n=1 Tax=Anthonomus grandis grandis TaxID=2921223 RepID=UPI0021653CFF|nr:ras-responsive element-binding protein 1-like [Anthonomus grandis grandis]
MQGVVVCPENPQQGSPPPNNVIVTSMEEPHQPTNPTKEKLNQSDSGIFSATNTTIDQSTTCESDNRSDCSSPERKYVCPICDIILTSQHKFTLHIRSHNNDQDQDQVPEKGFVCKICNKVLSSSSSLDRHVLVHSGERPFNCKYCGDTFTTNGNMHRHMRTHSSKLENYESDGSTDSGSNRSIEFNNNKVETKHANKRKLEDEEDNEPSLKKFALSNSQFRCPVCERADFTSSEILEAHLEDNHPEYPSKCGQCDQVFLNSKQLMVHKERAHVTPKPAVVGFKDLTRWDFSSQKFPHIARRECELNIHQAAAGGLNFQCHKCCKAFPCSSSLEIHEQSCVNSPIGLNLCKPNGISEDEIRRAEFFSRLNLQNNSPEKLIPPALYPSKETTHKLREHLAKAMDGTKDLADIQSILSNINRQQLSNSKQEVRIPPPPPPTLKPTLEIGQDSKTENEEETQDSFAIEFRKMKLRGEFPCRLCTAVFPNLRALKGHNRAHLSGNSNGTYYCNMCPHSSIDKAALIRHMRTHNGDRPYECSLCNYAFTTKANCERHLRNRHAKTTREDVKKSIIYHPSEDPTNDELNKLTMKDEKKHLFPSPIEPRDVSPEKVHCSTPKISLNTEVSFPPPTIVPDLQALKPSKIFSSIDFIHNENLKANRFVPPFFPQPFNFAPKLPTIIPTSPPEVPPAIPSKIQVKPYEALRESNHSFEQSDDEFYEEEEEVALDLSKKKMDEEKQKMIEEDDEDEPQDLTKKAPSLIPHMNEMVAQQLLKTHPEITPTAALYATQLANLCRNGFPGWGAFPVNPLLYQAFPGLPRNAQELKERIQRFQLCGGSMISEDLKPQLPVETPIPANFKPMMSRENIFPPKHLAEEQEESQPLNINVSESSYDSLPPKMHSPVQQPHKSDMTHSPNSVKMVIKNGVLMPKQKQRRYRTERPFTCEHCSAKFTLRSNMERHIKQQHPHYWSQRQRGAIGQPGRKPQGLLLKPNFCDLPLTNYEMPKMHDFDETKEHMNEKLRFALLAQGMQNNHFNHQDVKKDDDEDCALVIDENSKTEEQNSKPTEHIAMNLTRDCNDAVRVNQRATKGEEDLVSVSRLLDNASQQQFKEYFKGDSEDHEVGGVSEEEEEGLVASGSTSEGNISGTDENRSDSETINSQTPVKKKSAYSLAPNRVSCPFCSRKFPWRSSLRRHILTHTGDKPFKCSHCPLLFTTKSNCDRHLLRKHGNSATTIITGEAPSNANMNYLMRNVPERPFKCSSCPSSTFSTYSKLKTHMSCKHLTNAQGDDIRAQGYEAGSSEDEKICKPEPVRNDWENQISYSKCAVTGNAADPQPNAQVVNSDLPFKCHLCESSFSERQPALEHIRDRHASEYDLLMSKNALEMNPTTHQDEASAHHDEDDSDIRGKFPDYSNRKVICAWCMRRFWSAEDLRRHMRTHTGERPFSCDICERKFTLKHSMLRHRKKHALNSNFEHSDEDNMEHSHRAEESGNKSSSDGKGEKTDESDVQEGASDLIGNLLGIRDKTIIDKVLDASADDAAKLLGVRNGVKE